jgi:hypothetical protein
MEKDCGSFLNMSDDARYTSGGGLRHVGTTSTGRVKHAINK